MKVAGSWTMAYIFITGIESRLLVTLSSHRKITVTIFKQDVLHYWVNLTISVPRRENGYLLAP
jgi:hypothetical protein